MVSGKSESVDFLRAPAWAFGLLQTSRVGHLGTADNKAEPHVVPLCFAFDGRHCYSAVDQKPKRSGRLRRLRNIAENPMATLLVDTWSEDWNELAWVMVRGRAELIDGGEEFDRAIALLTQKYPQYRTSSPLGSGDGGIVLKLNAQTLTCWRP